MQYITFSEPVSSTYKITVLVPKLERDGIRREYIDPSALKPEEVIAYQLWITGKKTSAADMRSYLDDVTTYLDALQTKYILVSDAGYFKTLTGVAQADPYLGYVLPNTYPAHMAGKFQVLFIPNFRQVFYDPQRTKTRIAQALDALWNHEHGSYQQPGTSIIHFEAYPSTLVDIAAWLKKLHAHPALACDIEGFSLKHYSAGLGTISFAWSQHEGIAFAVDLGPDGKKVRNLLLKFFLQYRGRLMWHNASYDVMVKIYQLFMADLHDVAGLLDGLDAFYLSREWDDTKLITYLATNSCAGNKLGLKDQSQEFAGNYAVEEIKDITKIPLPELLRYNLVDSLCTWYVYNKHWQKMVDDDQLTTYEELFKPALIDITQMQLHGMPVDMDKVAFVRSVLEQVYADALGRIQTQKWVQAFTYELNLEHVATRNAALKKKQIQLGDEPQEFNPNSNPQLQRLLYEKGGIELPVIERTDTKAPATGAEVLEKLKAYTTDQSVRDLLDALIDFKKVEKILNSFIPALENAIEGPDGHHYLFGNFNLGGTLSGRLSSSDPNLQNLPANVAMVLSAALQALFGDQLKPYLDKGKLLLGKLIKDCFVAGPGRLMVGLDFASLEDRISALTTKDPNKLAVYIDGFDGHSLRAQSYFAEQMPDIERAPEGADCYRASVDGVEVFFHSHETVTYLGQTMSGSELWDRLSNVQTAA